MKEKFKFELAMYTAFCQSHPSKEQQLKNPTCLGDEVLRLIKRIVAKRGIFSYPNIAHIFLKQTQNSTYFAFKQSLLEYLIFSIEQDEFTSALRNQLSEKLSVLYSDHDDKDINSALILRTANRVFEYLTTENQQDPSALFVLLLSQGNPLTLVIVLLKIILICPHARTHLEARIADLICYYADYPEAECQWVVNFFEIFRVITTIYTENVEFNLVNMSKPCAQQSLEADTQVYRIFSQIKHQTSLEESNALVDAFADTFATKPTEASEVLPAEWFWLKNK